MKFTAKIAHVTNSPAIECESFKSVVERALSDHAAAPADGKPVIEMFDANGTKCGEVTRAGSLMIKAPYIKHVTIA